jgi:hypothetical protein
MKHLFIFSSCDCIPKEPAAIQGLIQLRNDNEYIYFRMVCIFCGKTKKIRQPIEDMGEIVSSEKSLMEWIQSEKSDMLLAMVMGDEPTEPDPDEPKQ